MKTIDEIKSLGAQVIAYGIELGIVKSTRNSQQETEGELLTRIIKGARAEGQNEERDMKLQTLVKLLEDVEKLSEGEKGIATKYMNENFENISDILELYQSKGRIPGTDLLEMDFDLERAIRRSVVHHYNNKITPVTGTLEIFSKRLTKSKGLIERESFKKEKDNYLKGLEKNLKEYEVLFRAGVHEGKDLNRRLLASAARGGKIFAITEYMHNSGEKLYDMAQNPVEIAMLLIAEYRAISKLIISPLLHVKDKGAERFKGEEEYKILTSHYTGLAELLSDTTEILRDRYFKAFKVACMPYMNETIIPTKDGTVRNILSFIEQSLEQISFVNLMYASQIKKGSYQLGLRDGNDPRKGLLQWDLDSANIN